MRLIFDKIKNWQIWLGFLIIVLIVFGSSLSGYFLSDDWHWLWLAEHLSWSANILITNYEGGNIGGSYNPFTFILFKVFYTIFGLQAWAYHLISLLVYTTNGFLVYLLSRKIFVLAKLNYSKVWASVAGILFLIWPTQSEVVNWLAAWPHLWGTTGYLIVWLGYFKWRREKSVKFFYWSLIGFILALGIKELAISLPIVILLWETYFYSLDKKNKIDFKVSYYFIILGLFFYLRYLATHTLFGYYGKQQLSLPYLEWVGNLGAFINDLFTFSFLREIYYKVWYYDLESLTIIVLVCIAAYFWFTFWQKKWLQFVLAATTFLCLLPMAPLGLSRLNFTDERYLHLALAFFVGWLLLVINDTFKGKKIKLVIVICLVIVILPIIYLKNYTWLQASRLSEQIVNSYPNSEVDNTLPLVSIGLPDNLAGAQVFRNNLQQALELTYPNYIQEIISLPIYTLVNRENYDHHLLKWREDNLGWFVESVDGSFVVTGKTSLTENNIYWELWNYNYQNYTANIIRLMPQDNIGIQWLTFDQGKLKLIK